MREFLASRDGYDVLSLDRVAPRERFGGSEVHERCDLLFKPKVEGLLRWYRPDAVLHFAAQARVDPSIVDPLGTYELNVEATLNVMRACKQIGVPHLVVASSEAIYGKARRYPSAENDDFNPANPYAASKVAVDVICQQFDRVLPTCVVRSGMGWGPRSNPKEQVVAKFIVKALKDEPLKFPAGAVQHPTRDLNHVADFAAGIERVIQARARGVYNLSGGREYTVLELAERVVAAVGGGRIELNPSYQYRKNEEGFRTWLDISKARVDLGHEPQRHFEGDALADTIKWYRNQTNGSYWS